MLLNNLVKILKKHLVIEQSKVGNIVTIKMIIGGHEISQVEIDVSCE